MHLVVPLPREEAGEGEGRLGPSDGLAAGVDDFRWNASPALATPPHVTRVKLDVVGEGGEGHARVADGEGGGEKERERER